MTAEKKAIRQSIYDTLTAMRAENLAAAEALTDTVSLTAYAHLTRETEIGRIWTEALQTALDEHACVIIPSSDAVYFIDHSVTIHGHKVNTIAL